MRAYSIAQSFREGEKYDWDILFLRTFRGRYNILCSSVYGWFKRMPFEKYNDLHHSQQIQCSHSKRCSISFSHSMIIFYKMLYHIKYNKFIWQIRCDLSNLIHMYRNCRVILVINIECWYDNVKQYINVYIKIIIILCRSHQKFNAHDVWLAVK